MKTPLKTDLIYLASLYSLDSKLPTDPIREERYKRVSHLTSILLKDGWTVLSPIVGSHRLTIDFDLPGEFFFWQRLDDCLIRHCDSMTILKDPGWDRSTGITAEIKIAQLHNKPISFIEFNGISYSFSDYVV